MARDGATSAFAGEPQPVEVFHRGRWYAGDLLGWRHEADGSCQARVRCVVGGLRHSAWVALSDLRLPRPAVPAPPVPRRSAAPARPLPVADDDTQPHLLLSRAAGRPPVPRAPVAVPAVPGTRTAPVPRAIATQEAVPVG